MKIRKYLNSNYTNYNLSECLIFYPKSKKDIVEIIEYAKKNKKKLLPIGSGLSWFDTIFNTNNILINLNKFKRNSFLIKKKVNLLFLQD